MSSIPVGEPCCTCGQPLPQPSGAAIVRSELFGAEARKTIREEIVARTPELTEISHYLHENPEIRWEEFKAHAKLTTYLKALGFEIIMYDGLDTAFRVSYTHGSGGRTFGLNSEYDALPGIGHACGHNLIAIAGLGALLGIKAALIKHDIPGTVVLIGTPAEEGGAGKAKLLAAGAYKDIGACMMLHPGPGGPNMGHVGPSLANQRLKIEYFGKPAHAAASPWEGINALDAATIAYASISALRQQLRPESRVHGVITQGGGIAANVIPAYTEMNYVVRGPTTADVDHIREKMVDCFEGAAKVSGCKVKVSIETLVKELRNDKPLAVEYAASMADLYGIKVTMGWDNAASIGASTDFGNVTYALPACHPMYGVPTPPKGNNHTPEFTAVAKAEISHQETFKAMTAMACVGLRYLGDSAFADEVRSWYDQEMSTIEHS